jgi:hypothetical protein
MSAINFPLTRGISTAANEVSSQNPEQLPTGGPGQSGVLRPDTVTLSAVFPPAPPVDAANFIQFQSPAAAPSLSQQEQLAQLNRVLEQLGINPQSISLDNRLALIKSANDPPALLKLVRTLGVLNEAATNVQVSALNANNLSNPVVTGTQAQAPAQNESQAQPPPASTAPLPSSSPPAGSGFESSSSGAGGTASASTVQASVASNAAAQFQELQALFQQADNAQNQGGAAGSGAAPQPSLSILV